jgi:hypothetical protein
MVPIHFTRPTGLVGLTPAGFASTTLRFAPECGFSWRRPIWPAYLGEMAWPPRACARNLLQQFSA